MNKKMRIIISIIVVILILIGVSIYYFYYYQKPLGDPNTEKLKNAIRSIENDTERATMINMFWGDNILTEEELKSLY